MTQPPATPPTPPKPPASQEEALAAWQEEQGYQKFATWMSRWLGEQSTKTAPPKTQKPADGGSFLGSLFGGS
jgi:hypothetical protein